VNFWRIFGGFWWVSGEFLVDSWWILGGSLVDFDLGCGVQGDLRFLSPYLEP